MLEVLMTKNENNSHAFMKKMAENIKLTRDAQSPDEPKANEVRSAVQMSVWWWAKGFTNYLLDRTYRKFKNISSDI